MFIPFFACFHSFFRPYIRFAALLHLIKDAFKKKCKKRKTREKEKKIPYNAQLTFLCSSYLWYACIKQSVVVHAKNDEMWNELWHLDLLSEKVWSSRLKLPQTKTEKPLKLFFSLFSSSFILMGALFFISLKCPRLQSATISFCLRSCMIDSVRWLFICIVYRVSTY